MENSAPRTYERIEVRAPFEFRRQIADVPRPLTADYLVRVDVCGLCRSDLHAASDWARDWQEIGHEFGGTIVAARRSNARFQVGDRVAVRNASSCGACEACRAGNRRRCSQLVVNLQGFRDYALCDERSLVDARSLNDSALALVEPTNVALDLLHASRLQPDDRIIVFGAGTLGLLTAYFARHAYGAGTVVLTGRAPESQVAARIGLSPYVCTAGGDAATIRAAAGGPADRVLVTTPPSTLERAMQCCRPGGTVLTVGLDAFERCAITLDVSRLIFGQQTIIGVCAAPNEHFEQAVALLRTHGPVLRALIARQAPRADLEALLRTWRNRPHFDGKTILNNRMEARRELAVA